MAIRKNTAPAEAQSSESLLSEARALEPVVKGLLNRIRDVLIQSPPAVNVEPAEAPVSPSAELIAKRLAAQQLRVYRVASIIEAVRGALPTEIPADQPDVIHALDEAKDILYVVADRLEGLHKEPLTAEEQDDGEPVSPAANASAPELPAALAEYLSEQEQRASELWSLLKRLDEDDDTPMCMGIAVRMAEELDSALDITSLRKALEAGESQP